MARPRRGHRLPGSAILLALALCTACGKDADAEPIPPADVGAPPGAAASGALDNTGGTAAPSAGGMGAPTVAGLCDTSSWPAESMMYEQALFDAINAARAAGETCGDAAVAAPGPLTLSSTLQVSARCHALEMSERGEATLVGADGSATLDRAMRAGYMGISTAAVVTSTAKDSAMVLEGLLGVASICEKLALPKWVEVGIGATPLGQDGKRYVNIVTGF